MENKTRHFKCLYCGGDLCWGEDAPANEVCVGYDEEDTAVWSIYTCSGCGRNYEISDPPREDRETAYAAYWGGLT